MDKLPFITIVMPVRNEELFISDTLQYILSQNYPKDQFEIIVADGMSNDRTRQIVENISVDYPNIKIINNPGRLPSSGRNVGFKNGKGDIFVVIDGHCYIPTDQLLKNIVNCFEKSGAKCLGRPQPLDPPGISEFQKAVALARASKIGHGGDSLIYSDYEGYCSPVSNGAVYKKEIFKKVGYVDEDFDACEDVEFNYRVEKKGIKAYMSPSLTVKYYPRETLKDLLKQMKRYGKGRFKFIKKHPEALSLNMLIPPTFVLGLLVLFAFGLYSAISFQFSLNQPTSIDVAMGVLSLVYAVYVIFVLGESLRICLKKGLHFIKYLPFIFFTIHCGLGLGFLGEMLKTFFIHKNSRLLKHA